MQILPIHSKHLILFYAHYDITKVQEDLQSTRAVMSRVDYLAPKWIEQLEFNPFFSITFLDTLKQKADRGVEKLINPGVRLGRKFLSSMIKADLQYQYQQNLSKNKGAFGFKKHIYGFLLRYQL
jgi:hypothetical protein